MKLEQLQKNEKNFGYVFVWPTGEHTLFEAGANLTKSEMKHQGKKVFKSCRSKNETLKECKIVPWYRFYNTYKEFKEDL